MHSAIAMTQHNSIQTCISSALTQPEALAILSGENVRNFQHRGRVDSLGRTRGSTLSSALGGNSNEKDNFFPCDHRRLRLFRGSGQCLSRLNHESHDRKQCDGDRLARLRLPLEAGSSPLWARERCFSRDRLRSSTLLSSPW